MIQIDERIITSEAFQTATRAKIEARSSRFSDYGSLVQLTDEEFEDLKTANRAANWTTVASTPEKAPAYSSREKVLAYIRGELPLACDCKKGHKTRVLEHKRTGVQVRLVEHAQSEGHNRCFVRGSLAGRQWLPEFFGGVNLGQTLASLRPYTRSAIDEERQEGYIGELAKIRDQIVERKQRGWIMLGPPGVSKSTYASAVLRDVATERVGLAVLDGKGSHPQSLGLYRIKVREWLAEMQAWDVRDLSSDVTEPSVTVNRLRKDEKLLRRHYFRPVLWVEELDRFSTTDSRINHLFSLIDHVYEAGGCVIVTANATRAELQQRFDQAFLRRLFGTNDDKGGYTLWDMHRKK